METSDKKAAGKSFKWLFGIVLVCAVMLTVVFISGALDKKDVQLSKGIENRAIPKGTVCKIEGSDKKDQYDLGETFSGL